MPERVSVSCLGPKFNLRPGAAKNRQFLHPRTAPVAHGHLAKKPWRGPFLNSWSWFRVSPLAYREFDRRFADILAVSADERTNQNAYLESGGPALIKAASPMNVISLATFR
jgi:hypothetical protein